MRLVSQVKGWLRLRKLASFLQRFPWMVAFAQTVWRIKQPKFSAGVVGVVFDETGRVLLVEHVLHPYAPWGLPGGWVDRRENPSETVAREMLEELKLTIEVGPVLLAQIDYNHMDLAYLCYAKGTIGTLSRELLDYGWYDPASLPRLHRFHYHAIQSALKLQTR